MIQLAFIPYLLLAQTKLFQRIPQPDSPTPTQVLAKANAIAKQVGAPVSGAPQVRWLEVGGGFTAAWDYVSLDFYGATLEPSLYLDSTVRSYLHSERWFGDESFVKRNLWTQQAIKKAVPQTQLLAELKPDFRNVRNRRIQPLPNSTIEVRWALLSKDGIPFHPVNPPQVIIDFDSTTHKIAAVNWRLNYRLSNASKTFNKQRAAQKLADLFANYFKRNRKPAFSPNNLDVRLMYVTDNGSRLYADGSGTWGTGTPNPEIRTYQVAYVGTYGREQIWLDASTLGCLGGFFGPQ